MFYFRKAENQHGGSKVKYMIRQSGALVFLLLLFFSLDIRDVAILNPLQSDSDVNILHGIKTTSFQIYYFPLAGLFRLETLNDCLHSSSSIIIICEVIQRIFYRLFSVT